MFRPLTNKHSANSRNILVPSLPVNEFLGVDTTISTDGETILSQVFDEDSYSYPYTYVFNAASGEVVSVINNPLAAMAYISGGGQTIALTAPYIVNGFIRIYNRNGVLINTIDRPEPFGSQFGGWGTSLSEDGSVIAIGHRYNSTVWKVYIINTITGALIRTFTDPVGGYTGFGDVVEMSSDGSIVAISNFNNTTYVYNTNTGSLITTITPPAGSGFNALSSITGDGRQIILYKSQDTKVFRYSAVDGSLLQTYSIAGLANLSRVVPKISKDGSTIALTNGEEARIFLGLNTTPALTFVVTSHPQGFRASCAISGDGSRFVSNGYGLVQFSQLF